MDLELTDEQERMRQLVRHFARNEVRQYIPLMEEEDQFPTPLIQQMGALGLMGIPISKNYGGLGKDFTSYIIAIHELSKVSASLGVILSVHTSVGTKPIENFGRREQKEKYLPKLARGEYLAAFALTEAQAGSDAANIRTRAVKAGDHYILNGNKVFITNAGHADIYITFARTGQEEGPKGMTAFIIEKDTEGLVFGKRERKMGLRGSSTSDLSFHHCRVHKRQRLGLEGEGYKIALAQLNIGRIGIAAQALGIAEAALEAGIEYVKQQGRSKRTLDLREGLSLKLADLSTKVEAAKLLTYQAADLVTRGKACVKEASMAKLYASQTAVELAIEAVQIYGEYGYREDYPLAGYFRDAKVTQIYEGTSEIQRILIAKHLFNP